MEFRQRISIDIYICGESVWICLIAWCWERPNSMAFHPFPGKLMAG